MTLFRLDLSLLRVSLISENTYKLINDRFYQRNSRLVIERSCLRDFVSSLLISAEVSLLFGCWLLVISWCCTVKLPLSGPLSNIVMLLTTTICWGFSAVLNVVRPLRVRIQVAHIMSHFAEKIAARWLMIADIEFLDSCPWFDIFCEL